MDMSDDGYAGFLATSLFLLLLTPVVCCGLALGLVDHSVRDPVLFGVSRRNAYLITFSLGLVGALIALYVVFVRLWRLDGLPVSEKRPSIFARLIVVLALAILAPLSISFTAGAPFYAIGVHDGGYNPFEMRYSLLDGAFFFLDQAVKGMLLDIIEVFKFDIGQYLGLSRPLSFDAWRYPAFGLGMVAYRFMMSTFVIGALLLLFKVHVSGRLFARGD